MDVKKKIQKGFIDVVFHNCIGYPSKGIVEFYTTPDGQTKARCRQCGKKIETLKIIKNPLET